MNISFTLNHELVSFEIELSETLFNLLRRQGFLGVKSGGCQHGECGACTVLLDGKAINSCCILAAQVSGHFIETIEAFGENPDQGWKKVLVLTVFRKHFPSLEQFNVAIARLQ